MVSMVSFPPSSGSGLTKSKATASKRASGTGRGCNGPVGLVVWLLLHWHGNTMGCTVGRLKIMPHVWPIVRILQGFVAFVKSKMSKCIMSEVVEKFADVRYVGLSSHIQESIFFPCPFNAASHDVGFQLLGKGIILVPSNYVPE